MSGNPGRQHLGVTRSAALVGILAVAAGVAGGAPGALQQVTVSPETFTRVASGVGLVRPVACKRAQGGQGAEVTGFLVGSRVIVTATAVVADAIARGCGLQVRLGGRWFGTTSARAWYDARSEAHDVDLATLELSRASTGHVFKFARTHPRRGEAVATLGHPLGLPLSFQQGLFRRAVVTRGVPSVVSWIVAEGGNRGGPIVSEEGDVIGVVSRTTVPDEDPVHAANFVGGLSLAEWFGASGSSDLCRAYPQGGIPDCPTDPAPRELRRWASLDLRESNAESALRAPRQVSPQTFARVASGVAFLRYSDCPGGGGPSGFAVGGGTGFLVGSQVVMTARHVLLATTSCRLQVQLGSSWYGVTFPKAWYDARSKPQDVDLATVKLTRPAPGHIFMLARGLPRRGDTVATLGHPLGLPLNFQQGVFRGAVVFRGSPHVVTRMSVEGGNSGGPIIGTDGRVIGVTSRVDLEDGDPAAVGGPNLAQWFSATANRDLCRAYPRGGIPDCPTDLARPGPRRWLSMKRRAG